MDNELHAAIVDAARRGCIVEMFKASTDGNIVVGVDGSKGQAGVFRVINTTDPALMTSAIRDLTEQVCR
jgi:hypothetical protein